MSGKPPKRKNNHVFNYLLQQKLYVFNYLLAFYLITSVVIHNIGIDKKTYKSANIQPGPGVVNILPTATPFSEPVDFGEMTYQEAIELVRTPEQAQDYNDWCHRRSLKLDLERKYLEGEYSFRRSHEGTAPVNCSEIAISTAALLSDNGYPQTIVYLTGFTKDGNEISHWSYIYKENGKYGSSCLPIGSIPPVYEDLESLILEIGKRTRYVEYVEKIEGYQVFDISENYPDWITREEPMEKRNFLDQKF